MVEKRRFPITISQLAELSGVNVHRIRNYINEQLISCCERTSVGYQLFNQDCLDRLTFLQEARNAGLLIQDIKPLLLAMQGDDRESIQDAVSALRQQIEYRHKSLALLEIQLASFENGAMPKS